jgi:RNA polymerase sigma factor (sigma-70 family)
MSKSVATLRAIESALKADRSAVSDRDLLARFVEDNDSEAFAALVRRHGAMVHGVCQRALWHPQDAEDACQATFLVLLRQARAQPWQPSVANWLYTTARKVAHNARLAAQRRARRQRHAAIPEAVPTVDQMSGRELLAVLDEELDRLPARYREPLVLCYLEGLTRDEAAGRLGVPAATLKSQLERGRRKLGEALTRRGCAPGAGLLALAASSSAGATPALVRQMAQATAGKVSPAVLSLMKGASGMFSAGHLLAASVFLVALLGAAIGFQQARTTVPDRPAPAETPKRSAAKAVPEKRSERTVTGRVLGPKDQAVKGCQVFLYPRSGGKVLAEAAVAADGTFRLKFDPERFPGAEEDEAWRTGRLIATAPGFGPVWASLGDVVHAGWKGQLATDDIAVEGTLTTLEGKPVAGAEITVFSLQGWGSAQKLDEYLNAVSKGTRRPRPPASWWGSIPGQHRWKTDSRGRYRITGLGRDRVAGLQVSGPGVASTHLLVVTRPGKVIRGRGNGREEFPLTLLPARHEFALAPGRTIKGVVKDDASGKPVAGMRVSTEGSAAEIVSGPDGRFELRSVPKKDQYRIYAFSTEKAALFINAEVTLKGDAPGLAEERIEIKVRRGLPVRVKLIDKATGKPEVGDVTCFPVFPNKDVPATLASHHLRLYRQGDGTYLGPALPGPCAIAVRRSDRRYVPAKANQKAFFKLQRMPNHDYGGSEDDLWLASTRRFAPIPLPIRQFQAVKFINPSKDTKEVSVTLELDPGQTRLLRFTDARGTPLVGVRWKEYTQGRWSDPLPGAEVRVAGVGAGWSRLRMLRHQEKKLASEVTVKTDTPSPLTVVLRPWATLSGRVVGKDGKPLAFHRLFGLPDEVRTDASGRFRIDGLAADRAYTVHVEDGVAIIGKLPGPIRLKPGEAKDLGDPRVGPTRP